MTFVFNSEVASDDSQKRQIEQKLRVQSRR